MNYITKTRRTFLASYTYKVLEYIDKHKKVLRVSETSIESTKVMGQREYLIYMNLSTPLGLKELVLNLKYESTQKHKS